MSPTAKPKTASSPTPTITSTHSIDHILVPPTTPINKCTSVVRVGSTTPTSSRSISFQPRGDSVARGRSATSWGSTRSALSSTILSSLFSAVMGDAWLPRFDPFQMNCSGRAQQRPFSGQNDASDPLPLSLVDLSRRRPKHSATSSPAQSIVGGTSPGNRYQNAREDHIDLLIMWMEDDHPVHCAEPLERPRVPRDCTMNPHAPQCSDQLVTWIAWQYDLATYLRAVDSCLVSTTSTHGNSPLFKFGLIDSPFDETSWDHSLTFTNIERNLMVTFITSDKTVMVDDTNNGLEYIMSNHLNLEWTLTIRVK